MMDGHGPDLALQTAGAVIVRDHLLIILGLNRLRLLHADGRHILRPAMIPSTGAFAGSGTGWRAQPREGTRRHLWHSVAAQRRGPT